MRLFHSYDIDQVQWKKNSQMDLNMPTVDIKCQTKFETTVISQNQSELKRNFIVYTRHLFHGKNNLYDGFLENFEPISTNSKGF